MDRMAGCFAACGCGDQDPEDEPSYERVDLTKKNPGAVTYRAAR